MGQKMTQSQRHPENNTIRYNVIQSRNDPDGNRETVITSAPNGRIIITIMSSLATHTRYFVINCSIIKVVRHSAIKIYNFSTFCFQISRNKRARTAR